VRGRFAAVSLRLPIAPPFIIQNPTLNIAASGRLLLVIMNQRPIYTQHALDRMAKRQLQAAWIELVITAPDIVEDDKFDPELEHRLGRVPELANRVLRVIVTKADPIRVVTMHLDRKMKRKL